MIQTSTFWQALGVYDHEVAQVYRDGRPFGPMYYTGMVRPRMF